MQLTSGHPFWPAKNGFIRVYEPIIQSTTCDVVIVGGGITGALLASALVDAGYDTVLLDCRNCAHGSTAATTALIQYEIDTHLVDLTKRYGANVASTAYRACRAAIDKLQKICQSVEAGDFESKRSFYLASRQADVKPLCDEYEARLGLQLEVEWMNESDLKSCFDFSAKAAILSRVAATVDAYALTHALLHRATTRGAKVYARTNVRSVTEKEQGVEIATDRGPRVNARWAVVSAGYQSLDLLHSKPRVSLHNTFAFATEPIPEFVGWPPDSILWESSRPYFYARTTTDGRAILGGADIPFKSDLIREQLAPKQQAKLEQRWKELFPRIPLEVAMTWSGTFAETPDGLPYIGFPVDQPKTFFSLCYGGNGIVYSVIAAEMLIAALQGQDHECTNIFRFDRA